jgi:aldose 1-epimerase
MLTLTSGASSLVVAPEYGAGIIGWMLGATPLLRRALPQASTFGDRHGMGCFPLLPYGNRLGHARFAWRGTEYTLKRNFGDQPHTIHGIGWQRSWAITEASSRSVTLTLDHQPDDFWPFAFEATVAYTLTGAALTVGTHLTNRSQAPAPAGIGLHPYFPKTGDPTLCFHATGAWENGADALPLRQGPLPEAWRHEEPRSILDSRLDNCFTGWSGSADILAGPASLRLEASEAFRNVQVFTPTGADFFCVEPVSHVPDALNRPDLPLDQAMHVLAPGETLTGTIRLFPVGYAETGPIVKP